MCAAPGRSSVWPSPRSTRSGRARTSTPSSRRSAPSAGPPHRSRASCRPARNRSPGSPSPSTCSATGGRGADRAPRTPTASTTAVRPSCGSRRVCRGIPRRVATAAVRSARPRTDRCEHREDGSQQPRSSIVTRAPNYLHTRATGVTTKCAVAWKKHAATATGRACSSAASGFSRSPNPADVPPACHRHDSYMTAASCGSYSAESSRGQRSSPVDWCPGRSDRLHPRVWRDLFAR